MTSQTVQKSKKRPLKRYKTTSQTVQNSHSKPLFMGCSEFHNIATSIVHNIAIRKKTVFRRLTHTKSTSKKPFKRWEKFSCENGLKGKKSKESNSFLKPKQRFRDICGFLHMLLSYCVLGFNARISFVKKAKKIHAYLIVLVLVDPRCQTS